MAIWYIADPHFGHAKILQYCNRPFDNIKKMDNCLVNNWNNKVKPQDIVRIVGDLTMRNKSQIEWIGGLIRRLNGRKQLILGNHDYLKPFDYVGLGIESVHTSMLLENKKIFIAHDPALAVCMPSDYRMICGHIHNSFKLLTDPNIILNVGVEAWDFYPVEENEV